MAGVFISIHSDDPEPRAFALGHHRDEGPFIVAEFGSVSVSLRGHGREASASARQIAERLLRAADEVDTFLAAEARKQAAVSADAVAMEGGR